jgi:hypothetical protein
MGWDFASETARVLTEGLPDPPRPPAAGVTFAAALYRGERFGAVLWLRLWRNGGWDSDTAVTERDGAGWAFPSACGGGGWVDPHDRPEDGWDGQPLVVLGQGQQTTELEDGTCEHVTSVEGMTSTRVASLLCSTPGGSFVHPVDSPLGAFEIVVVGEDPPTLVALDTEGAPIPASDP